MIKFSRVISTVAMAAVCSSASANYVTNPSFELGQSGIVIAPPPATSSYATYGPSTAGIPNWTILTAAVDVHHMNHHNMGSPTGGGSYHVDLNRTGGISQQISLPAAGTYRFSFWHSVHDQVPANCDAINAYAEVVDGLNNSLFFRTYTLNASNKGWVQTSGTLTVAAAGSVTVRFVNTSSCYPYGGMLIDLVNIEEEGRTSACAQECFWGVDGNNILNGKNKFGTLSNHDVQIQTNAFNRGIFTKGGRFGWNTNIPSALLHVNCSGFNTQAGTSDVRFENLESGTGSILAIDGNGYVFNTGIAPGSTGGSGWGLTGNAGTNPSSNWMGSSDYVGLSLRTNNQERIRVTADGDVGIGLSQPDRMMQVHSDIADRHAGVSGNAPSYSLYDAPAFANSNFRGRIGLATEPNHFVDGTAPGDMALHVDNEGKMVFGVGTNGANGIERMRINQEGYVGINTGSSLTDRFHIVLEPKNNESVRIENMQFGRGYIVVVDDDGRLWRTQQIARREAPGDDKEVAELRSQVAALTARLDELTAARDASASTLSDANTLGQNIPNPFGTETAIPYRIGKMSQSAFIAVYDLNGRELSRHPIKQAGEGRVSLKGSDLPSGTYLYTLVIDGVGVATKRMVLAK